MNLRLQESDPTTYNRDLFIPFAVPRVIPSTYNKARGFSEWQNPKEPGHFITAIDAAERSKLSILTSTTSNHKNCSRNVFPIIVLQASLARQIV